MIDVSMTAQWSGVVIAVIGAMVALARLYTKTRNASSGETNHIQISNQLLQNLREEISRLEMVIKKLNFRIGVLENNINALRNLEIHAATDFGALQTLVKSLPCNACTNKSGTLQQLTELLDRMRDRREERHSIINAEG